MLTYAAKQEIVKMRIDGFTIQEIADRHGVTKQYISLFLKGLSSEKKRRCHKCIFPGLKAWMVQNNVSVTQFFEEIKLWGSYPTLFHRLDGKYEFTLKEIKAILAYTGMTFDEAFGVVEYVPGGEQDGCEQQTERCEV